jgi:hypothetical protein
MMISRKQLSNQGRRRTFYTVLAMNQIGTLTAFLVMRKKRLSQTHLYKIRNMQSKTVVGTAISCTLPLTQSQTLPLKEYSLSLNNYH